MLAYFEKSKEIHRESKLSNAKQGQFDYRMEGAGIGGYELCGGRPSQEDRMICEYFDDGRAERYRSLDDSQKEELLKSTFKTLENKLKQKSSGSTAVVAIIDVQNQNYYVANVGDSQILRVESKTKSSECIRQNILHNPDEPSEQARLNKLDEGFSGKRIWSNTGGLAVSRSFGDRDFQEHGLIAEPEVFKSEIGENMHLVLACDGLTERNRLRLSTIGRMVHKEAQKGSLGGLAEKLAKTAYEKGSTDNISLMVINPKQLNAQNGPLVAAVFDGHSGMEVSQALSEKFMKELTNQLDMLYGDFINISLSQSSSEELPEPEPIGHAMFTRFKARFAKKAELDQPSNNKYMFPPGYRL